MPAVLKTFPAEGGRLTLYAVSPADATAEAHAIENNQVYFGDEKQLVLCAGACVSMGHANASSCERLLRAQGRQEIVLCGALSR